MKRKFLWIKALSLVSLAIVATIGSVNILPFSSVVEGRIKPNEPARKISHNNPTPTPKKADDVVWTSPSFDTATEKQKKETGSIPFKGRIDKDGKVKLVLRVYDQAVGGIKIFEETQDVEVSEGIFMTFVEVPSEIVQAHPTLWTEFAKVEEPSKPLEEERGQFATKVRLPGAAAPQGLIVTNVSVCFTCGGNYPFAAGAFSVSTATRPFERGSNCSGDLVQRSDSRPWICFGYFTF